MSKASDRSHPATTVAKPGVHRFLGLSLGGAKSDRTSLTVLDFYPKQEKAFIVDIYDAIGCEDDLTADQVLIELLKELSSSEQPMLKTLAVDVPLTLPPCLVSCLPDCAGYEKCKKPEVRWMRQQYNKARSKNKKLKHFTPYTQRPVDVYFRYKHPEQNLFQDETLGANLAPQTARMSYLKKHMPPTDLIEVWPKLALFYLQKTLHLTKKEVLSYRHLEYGLHIRQKIISRIEEHSKIFIYERDSKKIVTSMGAFDAFLCVWVAMQRDLGNVVQFKSDYPIESGWIQIPSL